MLEGFGGYGNNRFFAGYGYQWNGFNIGYDFTSQTINAGYGIGGAGISTFAGSTGLNYNLRSRQFGYNIGASYTHIFEKPTIELESTYEKTEASRTPVEQRTTHDCLLGACEYMGTESYEEILKKLTEGEHPLYIPGKGTKTLPALQKLYGVTQKLDKVYADIADDYWKKGGNVLVAQNRNHAIVLNKIEKYKVTYKYRRNNFQQKFKYTYMNPATGSFKTTGMRRNYRHPTYYFNSRTK